MKFTVKFEAKQDIGFHTTFDSNAKLGTNLLLLIREQLGLDEFPSERIKSFSTRGNLLFLNVPDDMAIRSGLFKDTLDVTVYVVGNVFNKYLYPDVKTDKNPETGEIKKAEVSWKLERDSILQAWEALGFPLEWGTEE